MPRLFDRPKYRQRNIIERMFGWLKENRRTVTRFDTLAKSYAAMRLVSVCYAVFATLLSAQCLGPGSIPDVSADLQFPVGTIPVPPADFQESVSIAITKAYFTHLRTCSELLDKIFHASEKDAYRQFTPINKLSIYTYQHMSIYLHRRLSIYNY
ncbi:hypothetical protein D3C77_353520 [compost metagenome]